MKLKAKGKPAGIQQPVVGKVRRQDVEHCIHILAKDSLTGVSYQVPVYENEVQNRVEIPHVHSVGDLNYLSEGDIVVINTDGVINTVYRQESNHNFFLFTERCNSNCLMCSQPPKDRDDTQYFFELYRDVIPLIPKDCIELGITGGEPTLLGEHFFELLKQLKSELPETELHCLTNGRSFAWEHMANRLGTIDHKGLMLAVPLYSDVYYEHDHIVQAKDAFDQTIKGLYNLAAYGQRIEIRIVLHKLTIPRLVRLARFIYRNLPFVEHVAFMGLEHEGYTPFNIEKLWIDPVDYQVELTEAITLLDDMGMNVSLYNIQLCTLSKPLWRFARKSISDWKNVYFDECQKCSVLEQCGGMFASATKKHSDYIIAI